MKWKFVQSFLQIFPEDISLFLSAYLTFKHLLNNPPNQKNAKPSFWCKVIKNNLESMLTLFSMALRHLRTDYENFQFLGKNEQNVWENFCPIFFQKVIFWVYLVSCRSPFLIKFRILRNGWFFCNLMVTRETGSLFKISWLWIQII